MSGFASLVDEPEHHVGLNGLPCWFRVEAYRTDGAWLLGPTGSLITPQSRFHGVGSGRRGLSSKRGIGPYSRTRRHGTGNGHRPGRRDRRYQQRPACRGLHRRTEAPVLTLSQSTRETSFRRGWYRWADRVSSRPAEPFRVSSAVRRASNFRPGPERGSGLGTVPNWTTLSCWPDIYTTESQPADQTRSCHHDDRRRIPLYEISGAAVTTGVNGSFLCFGSRQAGTVGAIIRKTERTVA